MGFVGGTSVTYIWIGGVVMFITALFGVLYSIDKSLKDIVEILRNKNEK